MNHLNLGATKIAIFIDLTKFCPLFLAGPAPTPPKTQIFTEKDTRQDRKIPTGVSIFIFMANGPYGSRTALPEETVVVAVWADKTRMTTENRAEALANVTKFRVQWGSTLSFCYIYL